MPDAPPLVTRSNNKPHEIQGPPTVRRTREQVDADEAAAAREKAAAEIASTAAVAAVATQEDTNRKEDQV